MLRYSIHVTLTLADGATWIVGTGTLTIVEIQWGTVDMGTGADDARILLVHAIEHVADDCTTHSSTGSTCNSLPEFTCEAAILAILEPSLGWPGEFLVTKVV